MKYVLGLRCGGLMEDPEFHVEHIRTIEADSLNAAKQLWAETTGHANESWNSTTKTYWGWDVVLLT